MNFSIDKDKAANRVEKAVSCFKEGFSCSQAILLTYGQVLGIDKTTAMNPDGAWLRKFTRGAR